MPVLVQDMFHSLTPPVEYKLTLMQTTYIIAASGVRNHMEAQLNVAHNIFLELKEVYKVYIFKHHVV